MKKLTLACAFLAVLSLPALAGQNGQGQNGNGQGQNGNGQGGNGYHGAPGPIAGAGLPILAVGYGAYWLVRRYRRKSGQTTS
jgi:hypothetical protein